MSVHSTRREGSFEQQVSVRKVDVEMGEDIEAILETSEGQAAVEDVPNFTSGGVTFVYTEVEGGFEDEARCSHRSQIARLAQNCDIAHVDRTLRHGVA